jgi:broad specificity phosphatase PhoE
MTPKNVAIEPELLERAGKVAEAEGKTVDELTTEALQRELARRTFERAKREGETRRCGMTDDDVERTVEKAVQEYRAEQRRG